MKEEYFNAYYDGLMAGLWIYGMPPKVLFDPGQKRMEITLGNGITWWGKWSKLNAPTEDIEIKIDLLKNCVRFFIEKVCEVKQSPQEL